MRIEGAKCQVTGANATGYVVVDANTETDRGLCSPQDTVTGGYTGEVGGSSYGLLLHSKTWCKRYGVVYQTTWDRD